MAQVKLKIPAGWKIIPFEDCLLPTNKKFKGLQRKDYKQVGGYPIVDQANSFISGYTDNEAMVYIPESPLVLFGDHTRILKYIDFPFALGADGTKILQVQSYIEPKFFYYYLLNTPIPNTGYNRHYKHLKDLKINLPSLPEQTKIVNILSKVDEEIEKVDRIIEKTEELKKGLMQSLLTKGIGHTKFKKTELGEIPVEWEVKRLNEVSDVIDSLHKTPKFSESGFAMVRVTDIKPGILSLTHAQKVNEGDFIEFTTKYQPQINDIVMSRVGSYGITSYVASNELFCMGQNTVVIHSTINSKYLFYYLNCMKVKDAIEAEVSGTGYKSLSLKSIRELIILVPALYEQNQISQILESIDWKALNIQHIKYQLLKLKKGLMDDLLSGKVRVIVN
jgi:type I restriction enzyme S subunit